MRSPLLNPAAVSVLAACAASVALVALGSAPARAQIPTPSPYVRAADSPFTSVSFSYFFLENFEDGTLNTPGVSTTGGSVVGPGSSIDSVDEDDGSVNGFGTGGRSFYSNGLTTFTFTFNAAALGALPTHAGIVWTDVGGTIPLSVVFEAFGPGGASLGTISQDLGDGQFTGQTAEDRFFGAVNATASPPSGCRCPAARTGRWTTFSTGWRTRSPLPRPSLALLPW